MVSGWFDKLTMSGISGWMFTAPPGAKGPPGKTPGGHSWMLWNEPVALAYWAAFSKSQWLVLEEAVPGKVQLSTTSGLNIMVSRNQKKGTSAKL